MQTACILILLLYVVVSSEGALPDSLRREIQTHKAAVERIIAHVRGPAKHEAFDRLVTLTDTYGPRHTGTQSLEDATDYCLDGLKGHGFSNVHGENVTAPFWLRNKESATMLEPRYHEMSMMSLGSSVGGNVTAEVEAVADFDELERLATQNETHFQGKIVLYNQEWVDYPTTNVYRKTGASRAAKHGAVAAILRSITQYSIYSPHTGSQNYEPNVTKIPVAAITVEDAQQIHRYRKKGIKVVVNLDMSCGTSGEVIVRNVVGELEGSTYPEEVVIIGGHLDSWDVGSGVMDDAGGVMISWQALLNLKELGLRPKRTIRALFWNAEEIGLVGAHQYFAEHKSDNESISLIMESDSGTFKPRGVGFSGTNDARDIMREIMSLLEPIDAAGVGEDGVSPDTGMWIDAGIPGANLWNANEKYFYYHHTHGDSVTMEDPDDLDLCAIVWTVVAYIVANLESKLPRTDSFPPDPPDPEIDHAHRIGAHNYVIAFCVLSVMILRNQIK